MTKIKVGWTGGKSMQWQLKSNTGGNNDIEAILHSYEQATR
jgi:hypothetical protein